VGDAYAGREASRYRSQAGSGKRERRGMLRYTDDEWAVVVVVAALDGMRPGAWAQQAAYDAARRRQRGERPSREQIEELVEELRHHRRVLTNIGGNLNDVARAGNATGTIEHPALAGLLRVLGRVVHGSDELIARVRTELLG
jgi:hypothetical protein